MKRPRVGGSLRIIGGRWRGRRLRIPEGPALRPTPDRVRETLFNWLAPYLAGASCVDLFAGSGALGLEAASRGAGRVVLVERSIPTARALASQCRDWAAETVTVHRADALQWLAESLDCADIVFLDPPFGEGLLEAAWRLISRGALVEAGGFVYMEYPPGQRPAVEDGAFSLYRQSRAGQVEFCLVRRLPGGP